MVPPLPLVTVAICPEWGGRRSGSRGCRRCTCRPENAVAAARYNRPHSFVQRTCDGRIAHGERNDAEYPVPWPFAAARVLATGPRRPGRINLARLVASARQRSNESATREHR